MNDARRKTLERKTALIAATLALASTECKSDPGYGVVDPMPQPAKCPDLETIQGGKATQRQDGAIEIEVPLQAGNAHFVVDGDGGTPTVQNGTFVESKTSGDKLTFVVRPTPGSTSVSVKTSVSCPFGTAGMQVTVSMTPSEGGTTLEVSGWQERY